MRRKLECLCSDAAAGEEETSAGEAGSEEQKASGLGGGCDATGDVNGLVPVLLKFIVKNDVAEAIHVKQAPTTEREGERLSG